MGGLVSVGIFPISQKYLSIFIYRLDYPLPNKHPLNTEDIMSIEHQLQRYIVYSCKECDWQAAVLAQWADIKPKRCGNKKCQCLFLKNPDKLDIKLPKEAIKPKPPSARKKSKTSRKKPSKKISS